MIQEYHFGSIKINGKTYNNDVEVRWNGELLEVLDWWREQSHIIDNKDIKRALSENPKIIIIGTGESGIAQVTEQAKKETKDKRIKMIVDITDQAIKIFNNFIKKSEQEIKKRKIIGLFHLTC